MITRNDFAPLCHRKKDTQVNKSLLSLYSCYPLNPSLVYIAHHVKLMSYYNVVPGDGGLLGIFIRVVKKLKYDYVNKQIIIAPTIVFCYHTEYNVNACSYIS
jgi:hypothetical protein